MSNLAFLQADQAKPTGELQGMACTVTVLVTPAESLPGMWVAHCLSLDVIAQGRSIQEALDAVAEAIVMVVVDDMRDNYDPLDRTPAPREYWEKAERQEGDVYIGTLAPELQRACRATP